MKKLILIIGGICSASLFLASCSDDSDDRRSSGGVGPANAAAFAGTSISFNPTITFFPAGIFEWVNGETGSQFPQASPTDPLKGLFTYDPTNNFRSGILTVTFDGGDQQLADIGDFVTVDGVVQSFTINIDGQDFIATVSGDLEAAEVEDNSGGGNGDGNGGGGSDDFTFQGNGNLAPGTTFSRNFLATNPQGDVSDSPLRSYGSGESADFRINDSGSLVFDGADGPLTLDFVAATDDGILSYRDDDNGAVTAATLTTGPTDAGSDFTIIWTGPIDPLNPGVPDIDNKVFANQ